MLACAIIIVSLFPIHAGAITLTAVNDTLLPLSDSTMPTRLGGELYVPYDVFSRIGVATSNEGGVLQMLFDGELLNFSTSEGYVYDQHQNSYASPAYDRNDTVYVPVKLCCGKFGLGYSTISVSGETVLRITDSTAQSDSAFTTANAENIESAINAYNGYTDPSEPPVEPSVPSAPSIPSAPSPPSYPSPPEPVDAPPPATVTQPENNTSSNEQATPQEQTTPPEPVPPPVEEAPSQKPSRVYLAFYGAPNENTNAILDALWDSERRATFFLPADDTDSWDEDTVRRIAAEGHTPALLLNPDGEYTSRVLTEQAAEANARLAFLTGLNARIVSCEDGIRKLTLSQRNSLAKAGYRLWDYTLDAGDDGQSAEMVYATTAQHFASTSGTVVLGLHHSESTAEAVNELASYMSRLGIPIRRITYSTTPINDAEDTR